MREGNNILAEKGISSKELRDTGLHPYMRALRELLDEGIQFYPRYSKKGDFLNLSFVNFDDKAELKSLVEKKGKRALINLIHAAKDQGFIQFVDNQGERIDTHPTEMPNRIVILVSTKDSEKFLKEFGQPSDQEEQI